MSANDVRSTEICRHGEHERLRGPQHAPPGAVAGAGVPELADRLGLRNEFEPGGGHPSEAVAFLRRVDATPADVADDGVLQADAVIHVASETAEPVAGFCAEVGRLLEPAIGV